MATHPHPSVPVYSPDELEFAREARLRLRMRNIADVLTGIGSPPGATGEVGSAALQDVRDDRA